MAKWQENRKNDIRQTLSASSTDAEIRAMQRLDEADEAATLASVSVASDGEQTNMLELNRLHQLARHWQSEYETLWVDGNFADQSAECVQAWIAWDDAVTAANTYSAAYYGEHIA